MSCNFVSQLVANSCSSVSIGLNHILCYEPWLNKIYGYFDLGKSALAVMLFRVSDQQPTQSKPILTVFYFRPMPILTSVYCTDVWCNKLEGYIGFFVSTTLGCFTLQRSTVWPNLTWRCFTIRQSSMPLLSLVTIVTWDIMESSCKSLTVQCFYEMLSL